MSEDGSITLPDPDAGDLHDAAHDIWCALHPNPHDLDFYDCKLCGATMYPGGDYTHRPDCPYEVLDRAIDAFGDAVKGARSAAPTEPPNAARTAEEPSPAPRADRGFRRYGTSCGRQDRHLKRGAA